MTHFSHTTIFQLRSKNFQYFLGSVKLVDQRIMRLKRQSFYNVCTLVPARVCRIIFGYCLLIFKFNTQKLVANTHRLFVRSLKRKKNNN